MEPDTGRMNFNQLCQYQIDIFFMILCDDRRNFILMGMSISGLQDKILCKISTYVGKSNAYTVRAEGGVGIITVQSDE